MFKLPDTQHLKTLLAPWAGKTALVVPMTDRSGRILGNNGDRLMHAVFLRLLAEFGIAISKNRTAADVVIVPPNGALLEIYSFPHILAERLMGFEDVPVVIFPSSAFFPAIDPSFMFVGRRAPVLWILRERHSYDHLRSTWSEQLAAAGVTLHLDHDVVASGHRYVSHVLGGEITANHILVASRIDCEAHDITINSKALVSRTNSVQRILASVIRAVVPYGKALTFVERIARSKVRRTLGTEMAALLPPDIAKRFDTNRTPMISVDVSSPNFSTFDEYSRLIREASVVITNRLHVALPATILGKQVFLIDSGYHKLRGVYEQSLTQMSNIQIIETAKKDSKQMGGFR